MNGRIFGLLLALTGLLPAQDDLKPVLENAYGQWRTAMVSKNSHAWKKATTLHRQMEVKNRILSEKKRFPAALFELPGTPPSIKKLQFLTIFRNGPTANAFYYGKIDFGVGEIKQNNLLIISFTGGGTGWRYDTMNFVNLASLKEVSDELKAGDLSYLKNTPEFKPSGKIPPAPAEIQEPEFIAKIYVFCPGRLIQVQINGVSRHEFANNKDAELIIGGARKGQNLVQFSAKALPGSTGKEVLAVRVYLMSQVNGVKPVKIYEYLAKEGEPVKAFERGAFSVDPQTAAVLNGRTR